MRNRLLFCLIGLFIFYQVEDATASHWLGSDFSADVVETFPKEPIKDFHGKIYVSKTHLRKDFSHDGQPAVAILDLVNHKALMIMPQEKMYFLMDQTELDNMFNHERGHVPKMLSDKPCTGRADLICNDLGREDVNGRDAEKWEVESLTGRTYQWFDIRLRIIIREEFPDHIYELRNIKEEPQPESLFRKPTEDRK